LVADPDRFGGQFFQRDIAVAPSADGLLDVALGLRRLIGWFLLCQGRRRPGSQETHSGSLQNGSPAPERSFFHSILLIFSDSNMSDSKPSTVDLVSTW